MSAGWSILLIVLGGLAAIGLYLGIEGAEHLRGAHLVIDDPTDEDGGE